MFEIKVWPDGAEESNEISEKEKIENGLTYNIQEAILYVYQPDRQINTGCAVVICPGGGYGLLAMEHEGHEYAEWLSTKGITGIVLKYRLPNGHYNIPLADAQEAIKIVRKNALNWNIDTHKIGISGFSAGGHLASTLGTHYDNDSKPDFMILFYPVITMDKTNSHLGTMNNLLKDKVTDQNLLDLFSNEKHVNKNTPPTILFLSDDDTGVTPINSIRFYEELKKHNISSALYIFPEGGHGWGLRESFTYTNTWKKILIEWLLYEKFV